MKKLFILIVIHGGASPIDPKGDALNDALASIQNMADICMKDLINGASAIKIVVKCLEMLENDVLTQVSEVLCKVMDYLV